MKEHVHDIKSKMIFYWPLVRFVKQMFMNVFKVVFQYKLVYYFCDIYNNN